MEQVFIGFGANLGDRLQNIKASILQVHESLGEVVTISSFYESEPWGFESEKLFVNGVFEIRTQLTPESLLEGLKKIEKNLGRTTKTIDMYTDRLIDLDILYFGNKIFNRDGLDIPHSQIYSRRFVLEPLVEIAPDFVDFKVQKTTLELLNMCSDTSVLKKIVF